MIMIEIDIYIIILIDIDWYWQKVAYWQIVIENYKKWQVTNDFQWQVISDRLG